MAPLAGLEAASTIIIILVLAVLFIARVATAWFARIARVARFAGLVAAGVGDYVEDLHRRGRIVTGDNQLATFRIAAPLVLDHDAETGARPQDGRKRIIDELEVPAFAAEGDLRDVQLQSPTLQIETVFCATWQYSTSPKQVEPVTASLPEGAMPETFTVRGPAGSLLFIVIVADLDLPFSPPPIDRAENPVRIPSRAAADRPAGHRLHIAQGP